MGIGETLHQALAKIVMRAAKDQVKTACGNLQLCAGLKSGIEGSTNTVGLKFLEIVRGRCYEEEDAEGYEEEEEYSVVVARLLNNLTIETAVTEEEEADILESTLEMEVE